MQEPEKDKLMQELIDALNWSINRIHALHMAATTVPMGSEIRTMVICDDALARAKHFMEVERDTQEAIAIIGGDHAATR